MQKICTKVFLAAFFSYVLALKKNLCKKCALLTLMKLTVGFVILFSEHKFLKFGTLNYSTIYQSFARKVVRFNQLKKHFSVKKFRPTELKLQRGKELTLKCNKSWSQSY